LDELKERLKDSPNLDPALAVGRELGMEWAPRCRKKVKNTAVMNPIDH
jgi:hypothetical protein